MQNEIDKYEGIDFSNKQVSRTKMKFNAKGIVDEIESLIPTKEQKVEKGPEIIDFNALMKKAVMFDGFGMSNLKTLQNIKENPLTKKEGVEPYGE